MEHSLQFLKVRSDHRRQFYRCHRDITSLHLVTKKIRTESDSLRNGSVADYKALK